MAQANQKRLSTAVLLSSGEQFSPYFGGALARWTYEVYRWLVPEMDVRVFGFPTAPGDRYPMAHGSSGVWRACRVMERVPGLRRYEEEVWIRSLFSRVRRLEVVHIHNRPQWVGLLRRLGYGGAIVLHLQNDHLGHWTGEMLDGLASQLQGVAVCSGYLRDRFAGRSAALAGKTRVVFNGVNTELFSPREELRENRTIFFVGRFDPEKGVLELVRAFARVLQERPESRLVIGGTTGFGTHKETAYVQEVRREAGLLEARNPGCVRFAGYLDHDRDLPQYFQKAAVFACPSLFQEPFGLVNAEAMACATPVVGSNRGGIPEVVGDAGILVNPEDARELAWALSLMLGDPDRRAELGQASLERAREMFDWRVIAKEWWEFLGEISD